MGEGHDQQGVSLRGPLVEWAAWCQGLGGVVVVVPPRGLSGVKVKWLGEGPRASGGSASPEDPPRTSLGKAHGPEGGTQPKEI